MSDDYDGGDDGLDDADNDGVPDEQDGDNDNDGIQDDQERTDWFGNHVVEIDGQTVTQMEDVFGNTVMVDENRDVMATVEPDGDIRMENGPTYTNLNDESGWRDYRGTDGSTLTISENTAGLAELKTNSNKTAEAGEVKESTKNPEVIDTTLETVDREDVGLEMGADSAKVTAQGVIEEQLLQPIVNLMERLWKWLND